MEQQDTISYISIAEGQHDSVATDAFHIGSPLQGKIVDMVNVQNKEETTSIISEKARYEGTRLPFNMEHVDSVFGLLLLCFLFFTHIYNGGYTFIKDNFYSLFSVDRGLRFSKQTTVTEILYNYFLVFQAVVLMAISTYDIFIEKMPEVGAMQSPMIKILLFIVFIGIFYGVKDAMYSIFGYIFDMRSSMFTLRRIQIVALEMLGIIFFIPTLLLVYSEYWHFQIVVFMVIIFLLVQILLFYQIIVFFIREKFNFLYLITYLCTFEILPYMFLFIGLTLLYRTDDFNTLWL
ncbi:DUF4271 domain-containing protein [Dysgonomonas sp. BGC7]|uniref:DUF4271 domain-containing protein n=1 Tax=Dysgonomonas sp. BGC7 TaxID=1658008 RepID=UPI000A45648E|nr:DUF4271 domain-containing protein [Dysgonomonas sp. BGC7]MBD8389825.1 DUF4271 domain-containing protein [Dysgonomonas sp. BGC7]